tara:strand:+ start:261 stop:797 length:537 start_codon:yes stop_codon:yes gene_type:complete
MIKLHLGCGKRFIPGYKHVDLAKFDHIDVFTSADNLSMFENDSVEEIYACHLLEYFDLNQVKDVLGEWNRVLVRGGILRLSVPDFDSLLKIYEKTKDLKKILGPIFGQMALNESTIYHRTTYNRTLLQEVLMEAKFNKIENWDTFRIFPQQDDFSKAFFPHKDPLGVQVSLNIMAQKI